MGVVDEIHRLGGPKRSQFGEVITSLGFSFFNSESELPNLRILSETLASFVQPTHIPEDLCTSPYEHTLNILALTDEEQWNSAIRALVEDSLETLWFIASLMDMWKRRVSFATRSGRISVASLHVRYEDKVCILFGGRAVYVLRKRPQGPDLQFLCLRAWPHVGRGIWHA
jgi:hypothetical protein